MNALRVPGGGARLRVVDRPGHRFPSNARCASPRQGRQRCSAPSEACYAVRPPQTDRVNTGQSEMRSDSWVNRVLVALSGITLVLVVAYIVLAQENRSVQAEVSQRQQYINQSIQLGRINDALIRALAAAAVDDNDDKLRELLAQNGITINPATGAPEKQAPPAAAPPAGTGR